jgi:hypothetical protein
MPKLNGWARVLVVIWALFAITVALGYFIDAQYEIKRIGECVAERAEEANAAAEFETRFAEWRARRPAELPDDIGQRSERDLTAQQRQLLDQWLIDRPSEPQRVGLCPDPPDTVSGIVISTLIRWARLAGIFGLMLWTSYAALAWIIRGFRRPKS